MIRVGGKEFYLQELNDNRIRCGLVKKMVNDGAQINMNCIHENTDAFLQTVKNLITHHPRLDNNIEPAALENQLKFLIGLVKNDLIPIESFTWLKDDRACYFTWLEIQTKIGIDAHNQPTNIYNTIQLSSSSLNTKERFDLVISFFDLWPLNNNDRLTYLDSIKANYQNNLELYPFKGLNKKDTEQIQWYYQYIKKHLKKYYPDQTITAPPSLYTSNQLAFYINPTTDEETYHLIYALYDTWSMILGDKARFKESLNKAYSQRKFRKKQEGKKPLNTYLKKETKVKLDQLREHYRNATLHDTLDLIIREAYDQMMENRQRK